SVSFVVYSYDWYCYLPYPTLFRSAPRHQVGVGCDGRGQVALEDGQVPHHLEQIGGARVGQQLGTHRDAAGVGAGQLVDHEPPPRSEEHTSELQSRENLVCRLLLEK